MSRDFLLVFLRQTCYWLTKLPNYIMLHIHYTHEKSIKIWLNKSPFWCQLSFKNIKLLKLLQFSHHCERQHLWEFQNIWLFVHKSSLKLFLAKNITISTWSKMFENEIMQSHNVFPFIDCKVNMIQNNLLEEFLT